MSSSINSTNSANFTNPANPITAPARLEQSREELEGIVANASLENSKANQKENGSKTDLKTRSLEQIENETPEETTSDPRVAALLSNENRERLSNESLKDLVAEIRDTGTAFLGIIPHFNYQQAKKTYEKLAPVVKLIEREEKAEKENKESEHAGKAEAKEEIANKEITDLFKTMDRQTKTNVLLVYYWTMNDVLPSPTDESSASSSSLLSSAAPAFQFPVQETAKKTSSCTMPIFLLIASIVFIGIGIAYKYMRGR